MLTQKEIQGISTMLATFKRVKSASPRKRLITFKTLLRMCTKEGQGLAAMFCALDPKHYGFKGEWYGKEELPAAQITRVQRGVDASDGCQYLPRKVYDAFIAMNEAIKKEEGRTLFLESGYRSPAYQLMIFLELLKQKEFDLLATCERIALPGWSEHGTPDRQALDLTTQRALEWKKKGKKEDFGKTPEYRWLLKNAKRFGFYLSYSKNNKWGVMFEPWHWHYDALKVRAEKSKKNVIIKQ